MVTLASYEEQMKKNYLQYAVSVVMGRALPDVRDGLKPVQRRVLYTAYEINATPRTPHLKSARIVGETMAKYHPHGDGSIYDAMVRMAQDFTYRYPLIDGQGNVGSIDGDSPAAMRYTEARLSPIAMKLMEDLEYGTVEFDSNFDGTLRVPVVLPTAFPNLLVNGSTGIAVGMSTNIPPHNLREVIDALIALIDNPDLTIDELMTYIPGPDFPTGGIIVGTDGIRSAYATGQGKITLRAKYTIENGSRGKQQIVITEIPYQVNKANLIEEIALLSEKGKVDGISEIRDESSREGLRIVIEVRKDIDPEITINQLFKFSKLQDNFHVQMIALVDNRPKTLTLKDCLLEYLRFKEEVVIRRTQFKIKKHREELHVLRGIQIAIDRLDEVVSIIRSSRTTDSARNNLMKNLKIDEVQATAILRMNLSRLVSTERTKLKEDIKNLELQIKDLEEILEIDARRKAKIKEEISEIREKFGDDRRTEIVSDIDDRTFTEEEIIPDLPAVISISARNYVKRHEDVSVHRPLKNDAPRFLAQGSTRQRVVLFTEQGNAYSFLLHQVAEHHGLSSGDPLRRYIEMPQDEEIVGAALIGDQSDDLIFFVTAQGMIKCTPAREYWTRRSVITAIKLNEDDRVVRVWSEPPNRKKDIVAITKHGMSIRFSVDQVSRTGRNTQGVTLIRLREDDEVIFASSIDSNEPIYLLDKQKYARKLMPGEIARQNRGGRGKRVTPKHWVLQFACAGHIDEIGLFTAENDFVILNAADITSSWKQVDLDLEDTPIMIWAIPTTAVQESPANTDDSNGSKDDQTGSKPSSQDDDDPPKSNFQLVLI